LCTVHASAPGLCPEPVEFRTHGEHAYLVTEFVPGRTVASWAAASSPVVRIQPSEAELADYYRRCRNLLAALNDLLAQLHGLGYAFADLGPHNVMIDDADRVRLIDFEGARRIGERASTTDAVARMLLFPLHDVVRRSPEALDHVRAELAELAPMPGTLWPADPPAQRTLPSPDQVRAEPEESLRWLRDRTADALEAMAEPDNPRWVYPTTPDGHRTNTRCLAHGTAGVLHALRFAGRPAETGRRGPAA